MRLAASLLVGLIGCAPAAAEVIDIRQGTNLSLAVDPAGDSIVVDLLGGLWRLPVTGGGATALIPSGSGIAQPRFDPAGERIVFQRWLDGQWDIWQLSLASGEYEPLTETASNEREPDFAPDGASVVFASDRTGSYQIWSLDLPGGALRQLSDEAGDHRYPSYAETGELAWARQFGARSAIVRYVGGPAGEPILTSERRLDAPSWRPGGGVLVYNERIPGERSDLELFIDADEPVRRRLTGGEDVFVGRAAWLSPGEYLYAADGQIWRRGIASTERTPVHLFAGASVDSLPARELTRPLDAPGPHPAAGLSGFVRHAASGRAAFTALGDLWLVEDDTLRRLTEDAATEAWPAFSPDGEWLIFASDSGDGSMEVWRLRLDSGQRLQLTDGPGRVFLPRVSGDGRWVAFLRTLGSGPWDRATLETVAVDRPFAAETIAGDLYDARDLGWQGGSLRLLARGASAGVALPRVFPTPAVAEVGVVEPERAAMTLPDDRRPSWQPAAAEAPYVIRTGRIFNGIGSSYTYLVDIHISGQRITDVVRRGRLPLPERVIDASEATVLPGLIDVHAHLSPVAGGEPGRQWLAHGVTTVRAVMADPVSGIERAEIWDSGIQPGPRLVIEAETPAPDLVLPPGSPIMLGGSAVGRGLSHSLAVQTAQAGEPLAALPPVIGTGPATGPETPPGLEVSTLGRSYQDVLGRLQASGAWLPTGLAAVATSEPVPGIASLGSTIERVMRSSGRVAVASDAPAVPYGAGFHEELALLAAQGIPPPEILRWATSGGALALGLSLQLGTIEPGRLADLVVVDGDPLDDISELARIEAVVRGGVWYEPAAIASMP